MSTWIFPSTQVGLKGKWGHLSCGVVSRGSRCFSVEACGEEGYTWETLKPIFRAKLPSRKICPNPKVLSKLFKLFTFISVIFEWTQTTVVPLKIPVSFPFMSLSHHKLLQPSYTSWKAFPNPSSCISCSYLPPTSSLFYITNSPKMSLVRQRSFLWGVREEKKWNLQSQDPFRGQKEVKGWKDSCINNSVLVIVDSKARLII